MRSWCACGGGVVSAAETFLRNKCIEVQHRHFGGLDSLVCSHHLLGCTERSRGLRRQRLLDTLADRLVNAIASPQPWILVQEA